MKCWKCGYDMFGIASRICPECGTLAQREPPPPFAWIRRHGLALLAAAQVLAFGLIVVADAHVFAPLAIVYTFWLFLPGETTSWHWLQWGPLATPLLLVITVMVPSSLARVFGSLGLSAVLGTAAMMWALGFGMQTKLEFFLVTSIPFLCTTIGTTVLAIRQLLSTTYPSGSD